MLETNDFHRLILDAVTESIAVINEDGQIQYVNRSWNKFAEYNACSTGDNWSRENYLLECDKAARSGEEFGVKAAEGIRKVINGDEGIFYLEYPCHSPEQKRWFMMRVTPLVVESRKFFVVSHQNITERKLAEEQLTSQARIDGLTGIANRRVFDEFIGNEWKRCARLKKHLSLAMIDLDHFKLLNDTYGHLAGDDCLVNVAGVLRDFTKRPGDLCARYGGEEFAVVWGNTTSDESRILADSLLEDISALKIPNKKSPAGVMTASIGLASVIPEQGNNETTAIKMADAFLYKAKESGRNRVVSG